MTLAELEMFINNMIDTSMSYKDTNGTKYNESDKVSGFSGTASGEWNKAKIESEITQLKNEIDTLDTDYNKTNNLASWVNDITRYGNGDNSGANMSADQIVSEYNTIVADNDSNERYNNPTGKTYNFYNGTVWTFYTEPVTTTENYSPSEIDQTAVNLWIQFITYWGPKSSDRSLWYSGWGNPGTGQSYDYCLEQYNRSVGFSKKTVTVVPGGWQTSTKDIYGNDMLFTTSFSGTDLENRMNITNKSRGESVRDTLNVDKSGDFTNWYHAADIKNWLGIFVAEYTAGMFGNEHYLRSNLSILKGFITDYLYYVERCENIDARFRTWFTKYNSYRSNNRQTKNTKTAAKGNLVENTKPRFEAYVIKSKQIAASLPGNEYYGRKINTIKTTLSTLHNIAVKKAQDIEKLLARKI